MPVTVHSLHNRESRSRLKQLAAICAADLVEPGMVVGLGSGSTAELVIAELADRMRSGLTLSGIATSRRTARLARRLGVPLLLPEQVSALDLAIDGADEVARSTLDVLKGRGGALVREKLVASLARRLVIVVDESKLVTRLGSRSPVPVEVVSFGWQVPARALERLGGKPVLRLARSGRPYRTDNGNLILDVDFGPLDEPETLAREIKLLSGVVDHGLFLGVATAVVVGGPEGVYVLHRA
jgi:ribose 5-phosphate isomerase A